MGGLTKRNKESFMSTTSQFLKAFPHFFFKMPFLITFHSFKYSTTLFNNLMYFVIEYIDHTLTINAKEIQGSCGKNKWKTIISTTNSKQYL